MKQKLEFRCSNTVTTKSGREIRCGSFLFEWFKGMLSRPCPKCGAMHYAVPKADGSLDVHCVPKAEAVLSSINKKEP